MCAPPSTRSSQQLQFMTACGCACRALKLQKQEMVCDGLDIRMKLTGPLGMSLDRHDELEQHTDANTNWVCLGVNVGPVKWYAIAILRLFGPVQRGG